MTAAARSLNPFRVLRKHRNYRIFWTGQTLSQMGSWMQTMAVGWLSLQLSDSAFVVGLVASIGALPIVLFSMHAGALVDIGDRMRIVRATQTVLLLQASILWAFTWTGHITVEILLILAFVQGLSSAVEIPARQAMIVQLVGRDDLQPAIALNSSGFNLARVIGPALGGIVIHQYGIAWCFGLNALSFVAVLWGLYRIEIPVERMIQRGTRAYEVMQRSTRGAVEGIQHLSQPGALRDLLGVVTISSVFGAPFLTLMPVVARDRLGLGAGGYGSLLASIGLGGLIGALSVASGAHHWRRGRMLVITSILFPLLVFASAFVTNVTLAHIMLFIVGLVMIMFNALSNGTLQSLVTEEFRGRLMAFYSLVFVGLSQALGSFMLGATAGAIGVEWAIAWSAVATLAYSAYVMMKSRALRRL